MASARKKSRVEDSDAVDIVAYVHNVTPVKSSVRNSKYFNMTLQTENSEYRDAVCFVPENQPAFEEIADKGSPISITCMTKSPSYRRPGQYDLLMTRRSLLQTLTDVPFPRKDEPVALVQTLADLQMSTAPSNSVHVSIKILYKDSGVERTSAKERTPSKVFSFIVGDATASMSLSLWQNSGHSLTVGKSYRLLNARVSQYQDVASLNLTAATIITEIHDINNVVTAHLPTEEEKRGTIISANIRLDRLCVNCCGVVLVDATKRLQKCSCGMTQKIAALRRSYTSEILLKDSRVVYNLESSALEDSLLKQNKGDILNDSQGITEYILCDVSEVRITVNKGNIINSLVFVEEEPTPSISTAFETSL